MFKIEGTKIMLTRGDSMYANIIMARDGETYTPVQGDSVRFALKHADMTPNKSSFRDQKPILVKNIPLDTMQLKIEPEDTKGFKFGSYVYDIQITLSNGDVDTFIADASFELLPEVD